MTRKRSATEQNLVNTKRKKKPLLIDSLTTPRKQSIFEEGVFVENADLEIIDKLLKSDVLRRRGINGDVDESKQLTKFKKSNGQVKYQRSVPGYGRVFAQNGLSIASLRKRVRHTLCKGKYIDWDMVNAHPTILYQLIRKNYPNNPEYWMYQQKHCESRDKYTKEIMDFKVERQRVLTDSYRRLLEASIPLVARFFVHLLRKMLTQSCEVDCGNLIFFQPPEAEKRRPPVGDLKIRRSIVFGMFEEYKKSVKVSKEYSRYAFYTKVRELKLRILEEKVDNCDGFKFDVVKLYQECLQRGYEKEMFALEGFQKKSEIIDSAEFNLVDFV